VDGVLIGCIYLPNGNPQPGPQFVDHKLALVQALADARPQAAKGGRACGACRRLQRRANAVGYLSNALMGQ
jgi:hypothetical protein